MVTRDLRPGPRHDPQGYLEALLRFWAEARDLLDDPTYAEAVPLLEALRAIPEPRDPSTTPASRHHQETRDA